jgi:CheY-like chemotaxis protein
MGQTLLVVEDEVLIRFDISDYLRAEGYEVLEASTAQEAIKILQGVRPVALVFTDVQMPGPLNGLDLADYVIRNHPDVKILVTSGHIRSAELPQGLGQLIEKPYRPSQIAGLVRNALS